MRTVRIVMGPSDRVCGKRRFIRRVFPEAAEILNVGDYQRRLNDLAKANQKIIEDTVAALRVGRNPVVMHTLYKYRRRKEFIEAVRTVTDDPIDVYVMYPSDDDIRTYIKFDESVKAYGMDWVKCQLNSIEIPSIDEGFANVYIVTDGQIIPKGQ